ncbi:hypothetical protein H4582DRAFT_1497763 [Lactarius indigo]|nr:hypothetical protein H4582DRAFT_1497763 [Lactarius indigo]
MLLSCASLILTLWVNPRTTTRIPPTPDPPRAHVSPSESLLDSCEYREFVQFHPRDRIALVLSGEHHSTAEIITVMQIGAGSQNGAALSASKVVGPNAASPQFKENDLMEIALS